MVQQNSIIELFIIASWSPYEMGRIIEQDGINMLIACMRNNIRWNKLSEVSLLLARLKVEEDKNQRIFGNVKGMEAISNLMV